MNCTRTGNNWHVRGLEAPTLLAAGAGGRRRAPAEIGPVGTALRSRGVRVPWNLRYGGSGVGLGLRYHVPRTAPGRERDAHGVRPRARRGLVRARALVASRRPRRESRENAGVRGRGAEHGGRLEKTPCHPHAPPTPAPPRAPPSNDPAHGETRLRRVPHGRAGRAAATPQVYMRPRELLHTSDWSCKRVWYSPKAKEPSRTCRSHLR